MKKNVLCLILIIGIAVVSTPNLFFFMASGNEKAPPPYIPVRFNKFPVPLYYVFMNHSPSEQAAILNMIEYGKGGGPAFITPFPNYLNLDHYPFPGKWYINTGGLNLSIKIDVDSYLEVTSDWNSAAIININGTDRRADLGVNLQLSYYVNLHLGHIHLNESLMQQYIAALGAADIDVFGHKRKAVFIPANTTIGVSGPVSFDFMMFDTYYPTYPNYPPDRYDYFKDKVNPFNYFTPEAQDEIMSYYDMQYPAMKKNGGIFGSRLNDTGNINEEGTLFGMWFELDWPYYLNETTEHYGGKYWFDGSTINLINVNWTNNETFYKDIETGLPFSANMIGMYGDADYENVDNYTLNGACYMYLLEGNLSQGIVNLTNYHSNERPRPVYMKYELIPSATSIYDDLLYVEYFDNLTHAQGTFTTQKITYIRSTQEAPSGGKADGIPGYSSVIVISIIGLITVLMFKKKNPTFSFGGITSLAS